MLSCKFSASPKEVQWFKGQAPLKASDKYNMKQDGTRAQLSIQRLTEEDSGEYSCQSGPAVSKGTLTVEGTAQTFLLSLSFGKVYKLTTDIGRNMQHKLLLKLSNIPNSVHEFGRKSSLTMKMCLKLNSSTQCVTSRSLST